MKNLLLLGWDDGAPYLLDRLLDAAAERGWSLALADADASRARTRAGVHPSARGIVLDLSDAASLRKRIALAALVVDLVPDTRGLERAATAAENGTAYLACRPLAPLDEGLDAAARREGVPILSGLELRRAFNALTCAGEFDGIVKAGCAPRRLDAYGPEDGAPVHAGPWTAPGVSGWLGASWHPLSGAAPGSADEVARHAWGYDDEAGRAHESVFSWRVASASAEETRRLAQAYLLAAAARAALGETLPAGVLRLSDPDAYGPLNLEIAEAGFRIEEL
ncbi:MAG: hypothetical protein M5U26_17555 [Planctomycetota bacterium]|nr:hypothetical protein [Planctomycetota bacterium]